MPHFLEFSSSVGSVTTLFLLLDCSSGMNTHDFFFIYLYFQSFFESTIYSYLFSISTFFWWYGLYTMCLNGFCMLLLTSIYSQTSVHELNSFLKVVRKPKLFSP
jgi:hypothetical protein